MKREILIICGSLLMLILLLWLLDHLHLMSIAILSEIRVALLAFLEIVALSLLLLVIVTIARWLLRSPDGMAVLPFEIIVPDQQDKLRCYNGRSIADSLKAEMVSIANIQGQNRRAETGTGFAPSASEQSDATAKTTAKATTGTTGTAAKRYGKLSNPEFKPNGENINADFADIAVVSVSGNNISIGKMMLTLKQMWNDRDPKYVISGSLQRYGNLVRLVCNLKTVGENTVICEVHKTIKDEEEIPELISDLSFKIWQSVPDTWKDDISKTDAKTWLGFKHFTMSLDCYGRYQSTELADHLDEACAYCLTAAQDEKGYEKLYPLAYRLGKHLVDLGRYDKAGEMFECAGSIAYDAFPAKDGNFEDLAANAHNAYGVCQWNMQQYPKAEYSFLRVIDLMPKLQDGYKNLSLISINLGRPDDARRIYEKALELNVLGQGNLFASKGEWLRDMGFLDDALAQYREAIKEDPKNAALHYICAKIHIQKQEYDQASEALEAVLQIKTDYWDETGNPHDDLGLIYLNTNREEMAIEQFHLAMQHNPYFALPYYRLGYLYFARKQDGIAIPELERAVQLDSGLSEAYICLGQAYDRNSRHEKAIENFKAGLGLDPQNDFLHVCLAGALFSVDQFDGAESEYREALKINPDNVDAHAGLAYLYRVKEDYLKAIPAFRHAIRLAPHEMNFYFGLAALYRKTAMWAEAIEVIESALLVDPSDAIAYLYLARCLEQQGDHEKAAAAKSHAAATKEKWMARTDWNTKEYWFACYESLDSQADKALDWLRISLQQGDPTIRYMNSDVDLDPLREAPAFKKLMEAYMPY